MVGDIDTLIGREDAKFSLHYMRMDQLRINFTNETIAFCSEWYRATAKEYVSKNAELILNMGSDQLLRMKTKIGSLVANTEKTVNEVLNNPCLWWHLRPRSQDALNLYLQVGDKHPIILDQAIRQILGRLGEVLQEFRFHVSVTGKHGSFGEYWFIQSTNGAVVPYYPHALKWSVKMQDTIREYNGQYLEAIALYKEMELLKDQKKREEALSRWDSF